MTPAGAASSATTSARSPRAAPGLAEFKRKWGADEVQMHRYYHPPPEPGRTATTAREGVDGAWPCRFGRGCRSPPRGSPGDLAYRWL